ncbi:MAG: GntR family transcriptional regulator [Lentisphaerota bacterium]
MRQPLKRLELCEAIKSDIACGIYPSSGFLPNEFELADKYGYSRNTVRSALTMLEDSKVLELLKGRGRRIRSAISNAPLSFLLPCSDFLSETFSHVSAQDTRHILKGVSQVAFEYECQMMTVPVSPTNNPHDINWKKLDFVSSNSLLIIFSGWYRDLFPMLLERGCRMAFIEDHTYKGKQHEDFLGRCCCLTLDLFSAAEMAVEHLFQQGCRRIGLFDPFILEPENPIMAGYLSGLKKYGLKFSAYHQVCYRESTIDHVKSQMKDFIKKSGGVDGIIIEPQMAIELKLRNLYAELDLDDNIKIISSADSFKNQTMKPSISSMAFPLVEIGRKAALELIADDFAPSNKTFNASLIKRQST